MPNLTPGYKASNASANTCAEECQKAYLPPLSFQVKIFISASDPIGLSRSHNSPFTSIDKAFRASPSLMPFAISIPFTPFSNSLEEPSGNDILIPLIQCLLRMQIWGFLGS